MGIPVGFCPCSGSGRAECLSAQVGWRDLKFRLGDDKMVARRCLLGPLVWLNLGHFGWFVGLGL